MAEDRQRYSDADLQEFKKVIQEKIAKAEKDLMLINESFLNDQNNGTDDTSPTFKAFEEGAETLSKEQNAILAGRQEKFLRDLRNALIRIENKTYGICKVTGKSPPMLGSGKRNKVSSNHQPEKNIGIAHNHWVLINCFGYTKNRLINAQPYSNAPPVLIATSTRNNSAFKARSRVL